MDEEKLIDELQTEVTNHNAFRMLVKLHKKPLYLFIRKIVVDHQDTDEVLQLTFIKVFKYVNGFKRKSKLSTWMMTIARKEGIHFLQMKAKKHNKSIDELSQIQMVALSADSEFYTGNEIQLRLQNAVTLLPEKQREVFNMKYFDKLKYTEIAEITGTSEGGLKANYFLAVKKLKKMLVQI